MTRLSGRHISAVPGVSSRSSIFLIGSSRYGRVQRHSGHAPFFSQTTVYVAVRAL